MPIPSRCPHCQTTDTLPDHFAGRRVTCKSCEQKFVVETPRVDDEFTIEDKADDGFAVNPYTLPPIPADPKPPPTPKRKPIVLDDGADDDSPSSRQKQRPRERDGFACPFCKSDRFPRKVDEVKTEAWIVFVILLFVCFPISWLPFLFMKGTVRYCSDCGMKLG